MYDVTIIGAGVIGSAAAYYLSQYQLKLLILEGENDVAAGTTKANSAIIHAGYDPVPGTNEARFNVEGSRLTKELCQKLDVPYKQNGAMVLAFSEKENEHLTKLYQRGLANGVAELQLLDGAEARKLEPQISDRVTGALLAPTSAIISPWEFSLALAETAVRNGAELKLSNRVEKIDRHEGFFTVTTNKGSYETRLIINAAGVYADKVAELVAEKEFTIIPVRGQYYLLDKSQGTRCAHTLFQCPDEKGKGVLVTPTVHGNLIVGPDAENVEGENTATTAAGLAFVREKGAKSVPSIDYRENIRNFAGVRARVSSGDFIISESKSVPGLFNLAAMASPALSSAAAIGKEACRWVLSRQDHEKKEDFIDTRKRVRFKELDPEARNELIKKEPAYGRVICRCETITEGEILASLNTPIPPCSIDGVKRRTNSGMGRCQAGFCSPRVMEILERELSKSPFDIRKNGADSQIVYGYNKKI